MTTQLENQNLETKYTELIDNIYKLVTCLQYHLPNDVGLKNYKAIVKVTQKSRRSKRKSLIEHQAKLFSNLFEKYRQDFLDESFDWLLNNDIKIIYNGNDDCYLPLSLIYTKLMKEDKEAYAVEIEAHLCNCILLALSSSHTDIEKLKSLCSQYVETKNDTKKNIFDMIGNSTNNSYSKSKSDQFIKKLKDKIQNKIAKSNYTSDNVFQNIQPIFDEFSKDSDIENMMKDVEAGNIGFMDIFTSLVTNIDLDKK